MSADFVRFFVDQTLHDLAAQDLAWRRSVQAYLNPTASLAESFGVTWMRELRGSLGSQASAMFAEAGDRCCDAL